MRDGIYFSNHKPLGEASRWMHTGTSSMAIVTVLPIHKNLRPLASLPVQTNTSRFVRVYSDAMVRLPADALPGTAAQRVGTGSFNLQLGPSGS